MPFWLMVASGPRPRTVLPITVTVDPGPVWLIPASWKFQTVLPETVPVALPPPNDR